MKKHIPGSSLPITIDAFSRAFGFVQATALGHVFATENPHLYGSGSRPSYSDAKMWLAKNKKNRALVDECIVKIVRGEIEMT